MRVWMIEQYGEGGIARYAVDMANAVLPQDDCVVATSSLGPAPGLEGRCQVWFPRRGKGTLAKVIGAAVGMSRLLRRAKRDDIGWVHLGVRPSFELLLVLALRLRRVKVVATVHNRQPHGASAGRRRILAAARLARRVVVHTDALEGWADDASLRWVRLPFPVPGLDGAAVPSVPRAELGAVDDRTVLVGFLGYLYGYKGPDVLLEALARALVERPDLPVRLVVAGRTAPDLDLEQIADRLGVLDRVHFRLGWLEERELSALLRGVDAVALPYRRIDNSGMAVAARAAGKPALASDLPGLRAAYGDGALYVAAGSAEDLAKGLCEIPRRLSDLSAVLRDQKVADHSGPVRQLIQETKSYAS